jgi:hypothetical protein
MQEQIDGRLVNIVSFGKAELANIEQGTITTGPVYANIDINDVTASLCELYNFQR